MTRLDESTVGRMFVDRDGNTWLHITYCDLPTARVKCVASPRVGMVGQHKGGAVGSQLFELLGLRLLVPEDEKP